jgi:lycopene beta-cyclase
MDHHYDIAIIGMGCAGSHVVLELLRRNVNKKVVVIDHYSKPAITKTWSYWEKEAGHWDHLIYKRWNKAWFKTSQESLELNVTPYNYKSINSNDFTAFAKAELEQSSYFTFIDATVDGVHRDQDTHHYLSFNDGADHCTANLVLDSRIDPQFFEDTKAVTLKQHFKGWVIETKADHFDPDRFTMMDYSLMDPGTTSFTYVLPFNKNRALVEFTYFSPDLVGDEVYESYLKKYISDQLNISDYKILEVEQGVIPMSTYDFTKHHSEFHFKIGTAGGWVKPSTGYSFKSSEKKAAILVDNYLHERPLTQNMHPKKATIYDATLLEVLYHNNATGHKVFYKMYKKNNLPDLLKFLDEETSLPEDVSIMIHMTSISFVSAFIKQLF